MDTIKWSEVINNSHYQSALKATAAVCVSGRLSPPCSKARSSHPQTAIGPPYLHGYLQGRTKRHGTWLMEWAVRTDRRMEAITPPLKWCEINKTSIFVEELWFHHSLHVALGGLSIYCNNLSRSPLQRMDTNLAQRRALQHCNSRKTHAGVLC